MRWASSKASKMFTLLLSLLCSLLYNNISQCTNALNLCFHHVSRSEIFGWIAGKSDTTGCARRYDIARLNRHTLRKYSDNGTNRKNHHARVALLLRDIIHTQSQRELLRVGDLVSSDNPWPHWTITVNAFSLKELFVARLKVTSCDIVEYSVTKDVR